MWVSSLRMRGEKGKSCSTAAKKEIPVHFLHLVNRLFHKHLNAYLSKQVYECMDLLSKQK